jgi:hypothetical protein
MTSVYQTIGDDGGIFSAAANATNRLRKPAAEIKKPPAGTGGLSQEGGVITSRYP